jgi:hypothetical protein
MDDQAVSAVAALKAAHAAGVKLRLDGEDLILEASAPPSAEILDLLSRHKPDIVALLQPGRDDSAQCIRQNLCQLLDPENADQREDHSHVQPARTDRHRLSDALSALNQSPAVKLASGDNKLQKPEQLLHRLATALATPRTWMRITDPERAAGYYRARALHMLATTTGDPLALVEREERSAAAPASRDQVERRLETERHG